MDIVEIYASLEIMEIKTMTRQFRRYIFDIVISQHFAYDHLIYANYISSNWFIFVFE